MSANIQIFGPHALIPVLTLEENLSLFDQAIDHKSGDYRAFCFCALIDGWIVFAELDGSEELKTIFRLPAAQCGY